MCLYIRGMAQEKITFQPKKGYKELLEQLAKREERSVSYLINRYVKKGLTEDGIKLPPDED